VLAVRCSPFSSDDPPAPTDAGAAPSPDVATAPDPEDDLGAETDAGALLEAGCDTEAGAYEGFSTSLASSGLAVVTASGGVVATVPNVGAPPPALRATTGNADGARAFVQRTLCGLGAPITCELKLRTAALVGGQAAFFDLRGVSGGVGASVRLKTNELQHTMADAGTFRAGFAIGAEPNDEFVTVTLLVRPDRAAVTLPDGGSAVVPAGLDRVDNLRAGVIYLQRSNLATAQADLLVDEIRCTPTP
jgi:hypothetical protein